MNPPSSHCPHRARGSTRGSSRQPGSRAPISSRASQASPHTARVLSPNLSSACPSAAQNPSVTLGAWYGIPTAHPPDRISCIMSFCTPAGALSPCYSHQDDLWPLEKMALWPVFVPGLPFLLITVCLKSQLHQVSPLESVPNLLHVKYCPPRSRSEVYFCPRPFTVS